MRELRLVGVHEDGTSLLLADDEDTRYQVPIDDALRAALRRSSLSPGLASGQTAAAVSPREVQALIRAGLTAEEVAERSGWTVEKVHRYEVPILAEREYVTRLARLVRLRQRGATAEPTLAARVAERLRTRGVDERSLRWDSYRQSGSEWTVLVTFAAGGRQRQATWAFDPGTHGIHAHDDEARWLTEDDASVAGPLGREVPVYDVEADGGVHDPSPVSRSGAPAPGAAPTTPSVPVDLVTAMRQRTSARLRGGARRRGDSGPDPAPASTPADRDALLPPQEPVAALPGEPPSSQPVAALPGEPPSSQPVAALPGEPPSSQPVAALPGEPPPEPADHPPSSPEPADAAPGEPAPPPEPLDAFVEAPGMPDDAEEPPPEPAKQPPRPARSGRRSSRTPVPAWKDVVLGTKPASD